MKKIRIIALLMAVLMLSLAFASCANTPEESGSESSSDAAQTQTPNDPAATTLPEETTYPVDENGYELDRLPELNYNGKEFIVTGSRRTDAPTHPQNCQIFAPQPKPTDGFRAA